jgi:Tfp pilus assembly protein PilF
VTIDPESAQAHASLGQAYQAAGLIEKAIAEFKKAVELAPNQQEFQRLLAEAQAKQPASSPSP